MALVIFLASLAALNFAFPDPIAKGSRISLLTSTIPIAAATVFDPLTGGLAGVMAVLLRLCFHPYEFLTTIPRCLSILAACGLGALIGRKKHRFAGLPVVVTDALLTDILDRFVNLDVRK